LHRTSAPLRARVQRRARATNDLVDGAERVASLDEPIRYAGRPAQCPESAHLSPTIGHCRARDRGVLCPEVIGTSRVESICVARNGHCPLRSDG
jgi:hypothetical protein